jgi:hypothetical protein
MEQALSSKDKKIHENNITKSMNLHSVFHSHVSLTIIDVHSNPETLNNSFYDIFQM